MNSPALKRLFILLSMILTGSIAKAYTPEIRSIDVNCVLDSTGCAHITEVWDVCVAGGTEWYLMRSNLGEIEIRNLVVREGEVTFQTLQTWDLKASLYQKKEKCGLNKTDEAYEICWGVGSYGDHVFTVSYDMTNAVKSLNDYDMLHIQFVSDWLSSAPETAQVSVSVDSKPLNGDNARIWGFGYEGKAFFEDGMVKAVANDGLGHDDSMILLIRLDKGIISNPSCVWDEDFQETLDAALEGSDWDDESLTFTQKAINAIEDLIDFLFKISWAFLLVAYLYISDMIAWRRYLGTRKKYVPWSTEIPFGGDICTTEYALSKIGESASTNQIASAMILQMINLGAIEVSGSISEEGHVDLVLGDRSSLDDLAEPVRKLWDILYEASGEDKILQEEEFKTWAFAHKYRMSQWVKSIYETGKKSFSSAKYGDEHSATPEGKYEVQKAFGLKKFLTDFPLVDERATLNLEQWRQNLVFGALFGTAEKIADSIKNLDIPYEGKTMSVYRQLARFSSVYKMANSISSDIATSGRSGGGGKSSHGGGGGFSGGGHGGGSR